MPYHSILADNFLPSILGDNTGSYFTYKIDKYLIRSDFHQTVLLVSLEDLADQLLPIVNAPTTIGLFHWFKILVGNLTQY